MATSILVCIGPECRGLMRGVLTKGVFGFIEVSSHPRAVTILIKGVQEWTIALLFYLFLWEQ